MPMGSVCGYGQLKVWYDSMINVRYEWCFPACNRRETDDTEVSHHNLEAKSSQRKRQPLSTKIEQQQ